MIDGAVPKRRQAIDEVMDAAEPAAKEVEVNGEEQVMVVVFVNELTTFSELDTQEVEAVSKLRQAMHPICLFHSIDFRELVNEHKLTYAKCLLDSTGMVLSDPP